MIVIRPAEYADVNHVAQHLRADDFAELRVVHMGADIPQVVLKAAEDSKETFAVFGTRRGRILSKPVALFGVADDPHNAGFGAVWFLATEDVGAQVYSIRREAPRWLSYLARGYPKGLHNVADKRNRLHIRWCENSGFDIGPTVDMRGFPFIYISRPQRT